MTGIAIVDGIRYAVKDVREGGMGKVFFLEREDGHFSVVHRRQLAAKTFKPHFSRKDIHRELDIWMHLSHPNILPLNAVGHIDDELAALSPWRTLGTLYALRAEDRSNYSIIKKLLLEISKALEYAWNEHRVLHLDIKPSNIFLGKLTGELEVADWGIARIMSENEILNAKNSKEFKVSGTLPFMSPERFFHGYIPSFQTDIYSTGMLALQLVTGQLPFENNKLYPEAIVSGDYHANAKRLLSNISTSWQHLVLKCISHEPTARFESYRDLIRSINKLPTNETRI